MAAGAEERAAAEPQAGAAARAAQEVYGKPANRAQQPVAGQVEAVQAVVELAQVGLAVEAETAVVAAAPVVAAAAGRAVEPAGADLVVEAELEEVEELVVAPARPANRGSGWPRQQCSREACWEEFLV